MGKITIEIRGFKSEAILDDEIVAQIYNALPTFVLEKGQMTLTELETHKREEKTSIQKPLLKAGIKFPTKEEVCDFIKSTSPNYEFSLPTIFNHFIGFVPSSNPQNPERRIYEKMWTRIRKAKKLISDEENGEWKSTTLDGETIYRFEKAIQEA